MFHRAQSPYVRVLTVVQGDPDVRGNGEERMEPVVQVNHHPRTQRLHRGRPQPKVTYPALPSPNTNCHSTGTWNVLALCLLILIFCVFGE